MRSATRTGRREGTIDGRALQGMLAGNGSIATCCTSTTLVGGFRATLLLDSRVLRDQQLNERRKQRFASLADVVHELEEPQVEREFLLGNAPMRRQPTA